MKRLPAADAGFVPLCVWFSELVKEEKRGRVSKGRKKSGSTCSLPAPAILPVLSLQLQARACPALPHSSVRPVTSWRLSPLCVPLYLTSFPAHWQTLITNYLELRTPLTTPDDEGQAVFVHMRVS